MATNLSAPFPDVLLPPGASITVTIDDANAEITKLNVYGFTPERQSAEDFAVLDPLLAYGSGG